MTELLVILGLVVLGIWLLPSGAQRAVGRPYSAVLNKALLRMEADGHVLEVPHPDLCVEGVPRAHSPKCWCYSTPTPCMGKRPDGGETL